MGCAAHLLLQFCVHSIKLFLEGLLGLRSLDFEGGRHHPIFYGKWLWMQMYCCNLQFAYARSALRLASDIVCCHTKYDKGLCRQIKFFRACRQGTGFTYRSPVNKTKQMSDKCTPHCASTDKSNKVNVIPHYSLQSSCYSCLPLRCSLLQLICT